MYLSGPQCHRYKMGCQPGILPFLTGSSSPQNWSKRAFLKTGVVTRPLLSDNDKYKGSRAGKAADEKVFLPVFVDPRHCRCGGDFGFFAWRNMIYRPTFLSHAAFRYMVMTALAMTVVVCFALRKRFAANISTRTEYLKAWCGMAPGGCVRFFPRSSPRSPGCCPALNRPIPPLIATALAAHEAAPGPASMTAILMKRSASASPPAISFQIKLCG